MGAAAPIVVTGRAEAGDFLGVRSFDASSVVFFYDSWGRPGLASQPVRVEKGERLRLQIAMPSVVRLRPSLFPVKDQLSVKCNGVSVLDGPVYYYPREGTEIYFGVNPIGGTSCAPRLHGRMLDQGGREIGEAAGREFAWSERLRGWVKHRGWQVGILLLLGIAAIRRAPRVAYLTSADGFAGVRAAVVRHGWFIGTAALSGFAFSWMITQGTWDFRERPLILCDFYDYQMVSLLEGRLDVPESAIGGEAFVVGDKFYGYFGMTPALLRFPFVVFDLAFGHLSRALMVAWFIAALVAAYFLLLDAVRAMRGPATMPSPAAIVVLVLASGPGSTFFFLSSRAYVYHEAILCGAMFALYSCWCALRHLSAPTGRWWLGALVCGVLSVHARPTAGLFALTFLGVVSVTLVLRAWREPGVRPRLAAIRSSLALGLLCVAGMLTFNLQAYLKFGTFDGAPLALSRPYVDPRRLAHIDGKSLHLVNVPFNVYSYLIRPNFRIQPRFPWLYLESKAPFPGFPRAKMDLPDHTLALPFGMPALCALAAVGTIAAVVRVRAARLPLTVAWLALGPMTLTLFAAIATAQRYTGDFCPFLIYAGAWGLAVIDTGTGRWRRAGLALIGAAALWSVTLMSAMALHYQREVVWGVPEERRADYVRLRQRIDDYFRPEKR